MVFMLWVICILKFSNWTLKGIFKKICLRYRSSSYLSLARKWKYKSEAIRNARGQPFVNNQKYFFLCLIFLIFENSIRSSILFYDLNELIFPWINFSRNCGLVCKSTKSFSTKFDLLFYPPKLTQAKFFQGWYVAHVQFWKRKILLFNKLNYRVH